MGDRLDLFDVAGQICVITGASSGLGLYCAEQLALRGATVFGISRNLPNDRLPVDGLTHLIGDVTDYEAMALLIDGIERDRGPITAFINNAGIADQISPGVTDPALFRALLETNTVAPAVLTDFVAARMAAAKTPGSIVNVSSVLATKSMPRLASYGASKAALESMTRQQAFYWARKGVRINAFAPGWFFSDMTSDSLNDSLKPILQGLTPMRRIGTVEDMIGSIIFLISRSSQFVTGAVINADGGYSI